MATKSLNPDILKLVRLYKNAVAKKIHVTQLYVFGSHAKGTAKDFSDIDVCVVSPKLGYDRHDERVMLSRFIDDIDLRIEPHPYNASDLSDPWDPLAHEILKYGVLIE